MNSTQFNKGINDLRKISMSTEEKSAMKARILTTPIPSSVKSVKSPWSVYSFTIWLKKNRQAYAIVALIVVLISGNAVAAVSSNALPGEVLYPIKTQVIEPLRLALAPTVKARVELQSSFALERLHEAERLATMGKLDVVKSTEINGLLDQHAQGFNSDTKVVVQASSSESTVSNSEQRSTFNENLNSHARILESLSKQSDTSGEKEAINQVINKVGENINRITTATSSSVTVISSSTLEHSGTGSDRQPSRNDSHTTNNSSNVNGQNDSNMVNINSSSDATNQQNTQIEQKAPEVKVAPQTGDSVDKSKQGD